MRDSASILLILTLALGLGCRPGPDRSELEKSVNVAEAKMNLSAAFGSEHAFFARNQTFAERFSDLGWKPEDDHRYAYFLPGESIQPQLQSYEPIGGLKSAASQNGFTILAVGNIDADPTLDIWSINDANEVRHIVDDVSF
jgi:hypothetical protein